MLLSLLTDFAKREFDLKNVDADRLKRYIRTKGFKNTTDFMDSLKDNPDNLDKFKNFAFKHNTYVNRDAEFWLNLKGVFFSRLQPGKPINILSLGCSAGLELVTVLMHCLKIMQPSDIHIEAWDISPQMVKLAQNPSITSTGFDRLELPRGFGRKYFWKAQNGRYKLSKAALSCLEVHVGDVRVSSTGEACWFKPDYFDLVLCRYMFIHLLLPAVDAIYDKLAEALTLRNGLGYFGIGKADPPPKYGLLKPVFPSIYRKKVDTAKSVQ